MKSMLEYYKMYYGIVLKASPFEQSTAIQPNHEINCFLTVKVQVLYFPSKYKRN